MKLRTRFVFLVAVLFVVILVLLLYINKDEPTYIYKGSEHDILETFSANESHVKLAEVGIVEEPSETLVDVRTLELWQRVNTNSRVIEDIEEDTKNDNDTLGEDTVEAIIVPHSHNDPGWLKTVNEYYVDQTKNILDNMLDKLARLQNMTFVWAETIFLSRWWEELSNKQKEAVKALVKEGRLEILGGGWVVPDEAVTHYSSLINNFVEGHLWLAKNLEVEPQFSWSLDPFGYSSFLPYLYKTMGFKASIILRIHRDIKKMLYEKKLLEFGWRQVWDKVGTSDMRTLVLPFMLYNIKHQCGPDQQTCLQFDFRRIDGEYSESRSVPVTDENISSLAEQLALQYRLKASMQRNKQAVLIPLGDDFRFDRAIEWEQQYSNYMKLFTFINDNPHLKVKARFGVVSDFFKALDGGGRSAIGPDTPMSHSTTLSGDFFPYSDHNNDYWTGFYSTRMWLKKLGRILGTRLHSAEVLHLRSILFSKDHKSLNSKNLMKQERLLTTARRTSALFQHHDAVTGTSKDFVIQDYRLMLLEAIQLADQSMEQSLNELFRVCAGRASLPFHPIPKLRVLSDRFDSDLYDYLTLEKDGVDLVAFNALLRNHSGATSLFVDNPGRSVSLKRYSEGGGRVTLTDVRCQLDLMSQTSRMKLSFLDTIGPNHLTLYKVVPGTPTESCIVSRSAAIDRKHPTFDVRNNVIVAMFDSYTGHLNHITFNDGTLTSIKVSFFLYEAHKDGAYLFGPLNAPVEVTSKTMNVVTVRRGSLFDEVVVQVEDLLAVTYRISVDDATSAVVDMEVLSNMTGGIHSNYNLAMRVSSSISSERLFFTDSNGFQSMLRERMPSLPLEANFYPATSYVFIESSGGNRRKSQGANWSDERNGKAMQRLTLLMSDPHGVSSTSAGAIEVLLDRKLLFDDGKGMGSGVVDNRPTLTSFRLLLENLHPSTGGERKKIQTRHPSLLAHTLLEEIQKPPIAALMTPTSDAFRSSFLRSIPKIDFRLVPSDISLAFLRYLHNDSRMTSDDVACLMVVQRFGGSISPHPLTHPDKQERIRCGFRVDHLFPQNSIVALNSTSLTLLPPEFNVQPSLSLCLNASSLNSFRVVFGKS